MIAKNLEYSLNTKIVFDYYPNGESSSYYHIVATLVQVMKYEIYDLASQTKSNRTDFVFALDAFLLKSRKDFVKENPAYKVKNKNRYIIPDYQVKNIRNVKEYYSLYDK